MAYVLSGAGASSDGDLDDRRADSALAVLRAYVGYLCQDHVAPIQDEAGQPVTLPRLLAEAEGEASAPDAQQQLAGVLADYTDTILWPWDDAAPYAYPPDIYWRQAGQAWARDFGQESHPSGSSTSWATATPYPRINELQHAAPGAAEPGDRGART